MAVLIAWLNALIPVIAVCGAYGIALAQGYEAMCNPFITGCTSISRAARYGDALFWFRGLMLPLSTLLVVYWIYQYRWLNQYAASHLRNKIILILGVLSAIALTFYANFLGSEGDVYRFMRRFGVTFYFGFAMLAQLLSVYSLYKTEKELPHALTQLLFWQLFCVGAQWLIGLISIGVSFTQPEFKNTATNILEWNYALMMTGFYAISGLIWRIKYK